MRLLLIACQKNNQQLFQKRFLFTFSYRVINAVTDFVSLITAHSKSFLAIRQKQFGITTEIVTKMSYATIRGFAEIIVGETPTGIKAQFNNSAARAGRLLPTLVSAVIDFELPGAHARNGEHEQGEDQDAGDGHNGGYRFRSGHQDFHADGQPEIRGSHDRAQCLQIKN